MTDHNIPPVDPAWPYAGIWQEIWTIRNDIEETIKFLTTKEEASEETDNALTDYLNDIQIKLNSATALLNDKGLPY